MIIVQGKHSVSSIKSDIVEEVVGRCEFKDIVVWDEVHDAKP